VALTTEIYDITKLAFLETLGLIGITISFFGNEKQCIARPVDRILFPGDSGGFVPEATTQVDMLDTDFDDWAGADLQSIVVLDDDETDVPHQLLTLQIMAIRRRTGNPIVHLGLKKDK
jgi:hypothetical protein